MLEAEHEAAFPPGKARFFPVWDVFMHFVLTRKFRPSFKHSRDVPCFLPKLHPPPLVSLKLLLFSVEWSHWTSADTGRLVCLERRQYSSKETRAVRRQGSTLVSARNTAATRKGLI